jgi:hypothetical protein
MVALLKGLSFEVLLGAFLLGFLAVGICNYLKINCFGPSWYIS